MKRLPAYTLAATLLPPRLPPVPSRLQLFGRPALLVGAALLAAEWLPPSRGAWVVGATACAATTYGLHGLLRRLIEARGGIGNTPSWLLGGYALLGSPLLYAAGHEAAQAWPLPESARRGLGTGLQALPAVAAATGWYFTGPRGALVLGGVAWLVNLVVAAREGGASRLRVALAWGLLLVGAGALYTGVVRGTHLIMLQPVPIWADFWTYVTASRTYHEHHLDPYWNAHVRGLLARGHLGLPDPDGHALQAYGLRMNYRLDDLEGRGSIGYAGTPLMLPLHFTLYRWLGFRPAAIVLTGASLLFCSVMALAFARRLWDRRRARWRIVAPSVLGALWLFAPFVLSLHLGQLEGLYVPLVALALYRLAFHPAAPETPVVGGVVLALASAIKIYPALFGAYLGVMALAASDRARTRLRTLEAQTLGWFLVGGVALAAVTWLAIGETLIASFLERLGLLVHLGAANLHEYRPSAADYIVHLLGAVAPTLSPDARPAIARGALTVLQIGLVWAGWRCARRLVNAYPADDPRRHLLGASWLALGLPILVEHWWSYYNVIQFVPLMIILAHAQRIETPRARQALYGMLGAGLVLANPETVRLLLWWAGVAPEDLIFLVTTPGTAHLIGPGWPAFLFGFPGQALLFAAAWRAATLPTPTRRPLTTATPR